MPIVIQRGRDPLLGQHLLQHQQVALGVLLGAEDGAHDGAGGIVDRGDERTAGLIGPEPVVGTAIGLQEQPQLAVAVPLLTMARRPPGMARLLPTLLQDAAGWPC